MVRKPAKPQATPAATAVEAAKHLRTPDRKKTDAVYRCTVEGMYYASAGSGVSAVLKPYRIEVRLPHSLMGRALSAIKNAYLEDALRAKYPDFIGYQTHILTDSYREDGGEVTDPQLMSRDALLDYISDELLPIQDYLYPDLADLRQAVADAENDMESFVRDQNFRAETMAGPLAEKSILAELNSPSSVGDSISDSSAPEEDAI
jgi:hypothetical protein